MFAVIRLRAIITVLHRDAEHRGSGEGRDDHRSRPDVWGNNDQEHRIKLDYIMSS